MDHGFAREKRTWEKVDGGLKLCSELAKNRTMEVWHEKVVAEVLRAGEIGMKLEFAQESKVRQLFVPILG